jgi:hypothetical protein
MKNLKWLLKMLSIVLVLTCLNASVSGQTTDEKNRLASMTAGGSSVRWDVAAQNSGLTITVSTPDGQVFRKEFRAGESPVFNLTDKLGNRLPDGQYTYELRLTPVLSIELKKELKAARDNGNDADVEREMRKRGALPSQPLVQSGSFSVVNGSAIVAGAVEPTARRPAGQIGERLRGLSPRRPFVQPEAYLSQDAMIIQARAVEAAAPRFSHTAFPDQVIPDDLIVQGSACVGLDCVNNESFGFDTIRLKENNTRIKFDDTSTSAGFPANDWQLTANDSASGGASKFSIEDITGSKVPFTITAGAATNSIFVDSTGRLGLRTSTPVLDVHANTSNTPAIRLEQNNSGGFTAQTWDIAGNEANFFVRDVTSGSRLPFRIRPGAPTSSVDISASGNVGLGTASPSLRLEAKGAAGLPVSSGTTPTGIARFSQTSGVGVIDFGFGGTAGFGWLQATDSTNLATNFGLLLNPNGGNVGIGTTAPTDTLSVNGTASKPGGGSWSVFSDERLKNIRGNFTSGLKAVMQLQPLRYEYRRNNALGIKSEGEHIGFGAQAVQKIIPEAVTTGSKGYLLVNNDPIIWAMLNAIKEQQQEIEQLKAEIQKLRPRAGVNQKSRRLR